MATPYPITQILPIGEGCYIQVNDWVEIKYTNPPRLLDFGPTCRFIRHGEEITYRQYLEILAGEERTMDATTFTAKEANEETKRSRYFESCRDSMRESMLIQSTARKIRAATLLGSLQTTIDFRLDDVQHMRKVVRHFEPLGFEVVDRSMPGFNYLQISWRAA